MTTYAQTSYRLEGNIFYQEKVIKTKDTLTTSYKISFGDSQEYPIIINKDDGRCYIWRKSKQSGKLYKYYLCEEICIKVCELTGITYSYKPKK